MNEILSCTFRVIVMFLLDLDLSVTPPVGWILSYSASMSFVTVQAETRDQRPGTRDRSSMAILSTTCMLRPLNACIFDATWGGNSSKLKTTSAICQFFP